MLSFLFWLGFIFILHSYVLYPFLLKYLLRKKGSASNRSMLTHRPPLSIIIPAHNEEQVLRDKLNSILASDYDLASLEILIGIDASHDFSGIIAASFADKFPHFKVKHFEERQGKIKIVNALVPEAKHELIILTDANVLFTKNTLKALSQHFIDPTIGLVDTRMQNYGLKNTGISMPESNYIAGEVKIKEAEGTLWGAMMGPFGGCFAFRKMCFTPIPNHFLVDDFYINMTCLEQGFKCINEQNAVVLEDVSNDLGVEFKRKIRISAGNFQNLSRFWRLLLKFNGLSFAFLSHKVLRWVSPVLIIFMILQIIAQADHSVFYSICYFILIMIPLTFVVDYFARRQQTHVVFLRYIIHFVSMNVALFLGLLQFLKGIRSSVWEPTKRHQ
ncbi:MAG: glycosyltransferase [Flavobacteriales bacterium]